MGLLRRECWSGLPFPSLGDLPDQGGIEPDSPVFPALQVDGFKNLNSQYSYVGLLHVFFFPLGFGNFILTLVMSNCILWSDGQCMKNFVLFYKSNIVVVLLVLFFHRRFSVLSSS